MILDMMQVSAECRGLGMGRRLYCEKSLNCKCGLGYFWLHERLLTYVNIDSSDACSSSVRTNLRVGHGLDR